MIPFMIFSIPMTLLPFLSSLKSGSLLWSNEAVGSSNFLLSCTAKVFVSVPSKAVETCIIADSGFFKNFLYQGGVQSTVFGVFEDLKFKISEG